MNKEKDKQPNQKILKINTSLDNILRVQIPKPKNKGKSDIVVREMVLKDTPYYDIYGHKLWGATAMMISEMEHVVKEII